MKNFEKKSDLTAEIRNIRERPVHFIGKQDFIAKDCEVNVQSIPLYISCGTTGYCENEMKECTTFIAVAFDAMDMQVNVYKDVMGKDCNLNIICKGDAELRALIESLRFILNTLEEQAEGM